MGVLIRFLSVDSGRRVEVLESKKRQWVIVCQLSDVKRVGGVLLDFADVWFVAGFQDDNVFDWTTISVTNLFFPSRTMEWYANKRTWRSGRFLCRFHENDLILLRLFR